MKERDDGIRETLWPACDGAPAAQPAHDDARVEHRERRDAELQGARHRFRKGARPRAAGRLDRRRDFVSRARARSEEHTSELQSLMRLSYAVFCLKKNK